MKVPDILALTKAHCSGFCFKCPPSTGIDAFERSCRTVGWSAMGGLKSKSGLQKSIYEVDLVKKAVHLVRNPYDNIVSRMHHALSHQGKAGFSDQQRATFTDNQDGFRAWCDFIDGQFAYLVPQSIARHIDSGRILDVPCHADLIRYVLWHNAAVEMTKRLGLPVYVLYYENYATNFNTTVRKLFDFLGQRIVSGPVAFESGKNYHDKFDSFHAREVAFLIRALASDQCWMLLRHYFLDWIEGEDDKVLDAKRKPPDVAWLLSFPNSVSSR